MTSSSYAKTRRGELQQARSFERLTFMNALSHRPNAPQQQERAPLPAANGPLMTVIRGVILLLLAGFLLFAHGCHGDKDTELSTPLRTIASPAGGQERLYPWMRELKPPSAATFG